MEPKTCHLKLKQLFFEVAQKYISDKKDVEKIFDDVVKNYTSKRRHYHNLDHICKLCDLWIEYKDVFVHPDFVFFAIVFHDIIYSPRSSSNEEKSSFYFMKTIAKYDLENSFVCGVMELIQSTKHDRRSVVSANRNRNRDMKLLMDFDLFGLASSEEEFLLNSAKIRKEYRIYPNFLYRKGRIKFLKAFLMRDKIFLSREFSKLEKIARKNIESEINLLTLKKI